VSGVDGLGSLTVVITNWGTPDYTIRAAQAVIADGVPPDRVVVVDNGSKDDSYERFRQQLASCVLVPLEENIGFGRASNLGASELPGDHYLFVNNDAFVHEPGSVGRMLDCLDVPGVGLVVPRLRNTDLTLQPSVVPTHRPGAELVRASGLSRFLPNRWRPRWSTHWDHGSSREIDAAIGPVMLVHGETWARLGGFDERIYMYAEDLDLCWRTRLLGRKIWFCAGAEFVHIGNAAASRAWTSPRRAELVARSEADMIRRHHSSGTARLTIGLICAGLAGRWVVHSALRNRDAATTLRASIRGFLGGAGEAD
jgi:N-acetylglucosaminyl-diphospho-decaprenol L-rhamnosyltransferase